MDNVLQPPNGGWGWMVVLGAALINMVNQSIFSIFGLIFGEQLKLMANGKAFGITLVMALNVMTTNFSGLAVPPLLKKLNIRSLTIIAIICVGTGMLISSFATHIYVIVLGYSCITGFGLGIVASSTFLIINDYFTTKKSSAVGLAMAGTSIGQMLMPLLVGYLLETYGFSVTTKILGLMSYSGILATLLFKPFSCFCFKKPVQNTTIPETMSILPKQENHIVVIPAIEEKKADNNNESNSYTPIAPIRRKKSFNQSISADETSEIDEKKQEIIKQKAYSFSRQNSFTSYNSESDTNQFSADETKKRIPPKPPIRRKRSNASNLSITERQTLPRVRRTSTNPFDSDEDAAKENVLGNRRPSLNPFGSDSDSDIDKEVVIRKHEYLAPAKRESSNPFDSDDNDDDQKKVQKKRRPSLNPFGSDSESDVEKKQKLINTIHKSRTSLNPFGSDSEEDVRIINNTEDRVENKIDLDTTTTILSDLKDAMANLEKLYDENLYISKENSTENNELEKTYYGSDKIVNNNGKGEKASNNITTQNPKEDEIEEHTKLLSNSNGIHRIYSDSSITDIESNRIKKKKKRKEKCNGSCDEGVRLCKHAKHDQLNSLESSLMVSLNSQPSLSKTIVDKPRGCCSKFTRALGLKLLKDLKFVHILLGLALGYVSSVTFSTFFPLFLQDEAKLDIIHTTSCMTALSFGDLTGRMTISEIARRLKMSSRMLFIVGALFLGISRSYLVLSTTFESLLIASLMTGYFRAATVITQNLVVSEYIAHDDLPQAVGINMVTKGIFILTIGQLLGLLKDQFSYGLCIHILNAGLYIVAFSWLGEILKNKCFGSPTVVAVIDAKC